MRPERVLCPMLALVGACIIPDREIRSEGDQDNPGAVRIVEPITVVAEMYDACNRDEKEDPGPDTRQCPQVPTSTPQGRLRGGPFCSCPGRDVNTLPEIILYAEDPARGRDAPVDTLYAVALLDLDPSTTAPQNFVAYPEHLTPGGRGEYVPRINLLEDPQGRLAPSLGREGNGLWRFRLGKDQGEGVDLCNDNNGAIVAPGLHNLQIMVTDRPFFQAPRLDENGEPVLDQSGRPVLLAPQHGMPDIAVGATWSVANYVFSCEDPEQNSDCECVETSP